MLIIRLLLSGVTEIRTRDTLLAYTRFPGVPLQPLEHHSFGFWLWGCYFFISFAKVGYFFDFCEFFVSFFSGVVEVVTLFTIFYFLICGLHVYYMVII